MENKTTGTVKWFNSEKGFGFIQVDNGSNDIFVHHSDVMSKSYGRIELNDGQKVSFLVKQGQRGQQASNVELI